MTGPDADPNLPRWRVPQASPEAPRSQAPQASPEAPRSQAPQASPEASEPAGAPAVPAAADQVGPGEPDRAADLEDRLRRALADADNLRKRCERLVADARADERARVAAAWLPIVDNLERALEHASADSGMVIEGVRAVRDQSVALLGSLGFPRHDETDVAFDPQLHEAVSVVPDDDAPEGTVVRVLRPGYGEGTQQLRPAAVVVAGRSG
jgi:molecular chaperone GrpE